MKPTDVVRIRENDPEFPGEIGIIRLTDEDSFEFLVELNKGGSYWFEETDLELLEGTNLSDYYTERRITSG